MHEIPAVAHRQVGKTLPAWALCRGRRGLSRFHVDERKAIQCRGSAEALMQARIRSIRWEAESVNSYSLEPLNETEFPDFTAGSHINVTLSSGLARSYSLANDPAERNRYEIAVQHAIESRGGSSHIHQTWRVGQILEISSPRNNFPLFEDACHTILFAGGIGVTPILSMMARLTALKRSWELHYVTRRRESAAYLDRIGTYDTTKVMFDGEPAGGRLDMKAIIESAPPETHIYCCGPVGMLNAFESLTAASPAGTAHVEYFSSETAIAVGGGYTVELRRSKRTLKVEGGGIDA